MKKLYIIFVILSVSVFCFYFKYQDNNADNDFYKKHFEGCIEMTKSTVKGSKYLKINNNTYFVSIMHFNYSSCDIKVGDSIVKKANTFNIDIYRDGKLYYRYIGDEE